MKKLAILCAFVLMTALVGCELTAPAGPKIGVVDPGIIFQDSAPGKAGVAYLEGISKKMQDEFVALQEEVQETQSQEAQMKLQMLASEFQQRITAEQQQVINTLQDEFKKVLEDYRVKNNLEIILAKDQVLAFDNTVNVTEPILAAMNALTIDYAALAEEKAAAEAAETPDAAAPAAPQAPVEEAPAADAKKAE